MLASVIEQMKKQRRTAGVVLFIGAVFYAGYLAGSGYEIKNKKDAQLAPDAAKEERTEAKTLDADVSLLWETIELAKEKYVRVEKVDDKKVLYGAIRGAIEAFGDPYSAFLEPSDAKKFSEELKGNFGGIGAEIGVRKGQLVVMVPLKGTPAERAGLKAGDKILEVDDVVTENLSVEEAVKLIRGEEGTTVRLRIFRDEWEETKEFTITRERIVVPTLEWEIIAAEPGGAKDIFLVKLFNFNEQAPAEFGNASFSALFKGIKGVILDMRNNPGGYLEGAVQIAGWFVDRGEVVVREKLRGDEKTPFRARGKSAFRSIPVVVLINEGSASASEIVAGALRDLRGVKLVGKKTFGKGSVQELETLRDGSTLKITIAEWLTPNNHAIDETGLIPDFEIEESDDPKEDLQLKKALGVLKPQLEEGPAIPRVFFEL